MKIPIIFTLCFVALVAAHPAQEEVSEETKTMADQNKYCVEQTEITLEELEHLSKNPTADITRSGMCYIKCVAMEGGVEKDGVLLKDAAVEKRPEGLSKEDAEKAIDECGKIVTADPCETSYMRYTCIFEKGERRSWLKAD